ncbi:MAG: nucleotide sugar dehydrogenase [Clostridia bacterium]|jgi:UDP-N-acetyl-D-mannosaminuronic acid dehydrogenase|nr:nucleotide sugar dehydrogenase [Clostridia bacterium]MCI2000580.1 nucleotide sugar dehydrogenase [Clostridia bacterium]MCI2015036.1 nucleotide sugar dehydrogenase [Clostridia bacterium]
MNTKVCVVGLGYIGLPTSIMMASHGVNVVGVDYNKALVDKLNSGHMTFKEKGIDDIFFDAISKGIKFSHEGVSADIYIVAVPTPYNKLSKKIDPSYVINAVKDVMSVCSKGAIIVIESTISPSTMDKYIRPVIEKNGFVIGKDIHIAHAPERIIPGNMVYELQHNSRTIGVDEPYIGEKIKEIYSSFCQNEIVITDIKTAEMTKVVENTFRDINIAFANELAKICRQDNMNVYEIIKIANKHPRVNILQPGPGVGGHCISVDPWFLVGDYPNLALLTHEARKINDSMPEFVLERISCIMEERGITDVSRVGLYGLTYKEDVDDVRESPTLQLLENMKKHLASGVKVFDPMVANKNIVPNMIYDFDEFLDSIDILVVMVAHSHLKKNINKIKDKIIFDTRNVFELNKNVYKL